jgi:hypothetical protein
MWQPRGACTGAAQSHEGGKRHAVYRTFDAFGPVICSKSVGFLVFSDYVSVLHAAHEKACFCQDLMKIAFFFLHLPKSAFGGIVAIDHAFEN